VLSLINDEKNQLDATSVIYYHKLTLRVSSIYMLIFRSTGCNLLHLLFRTVRENKVLVIGLCCSVCRVVLTTFSFGYQAAPDTLTQKYVQVYSSGCRTLGHNVAEYLRGTSADSLSIFEELRKTR
jgi:hypothetical protein